jgi:hypothetical protein
MKFDECIEALIGLEASDRDLTPAPIDDIIDPYVVGFGCQIEKVRGAVAIGFREKAPLSARSELIFKYLASGAGPIFLRQVPVAGSAKFGPQESVRLLVG